MGQVLLLALVLLFGAGCVGTVGGRMRAIETALPTEHATPHQLQRLHAAFIRDDGTLILQIQGKPVKETKTQPCTLEIPPPKRTSRKETIARRVEVPSSALHLGWDTNAVTATNVHVLPIGPVMVLKDKEVYVWDDLALTEGRAEEIRLVQRLGTVSQWEILHLRAQPSPTQARFTIYEVRPTMIPVKGPTKPALILDAVLEEVLTKMLTII